jgi:hypothetical protein
MIPILKKIASDEFTRIVFIGIPKRKDKLFELLYDFAKQDKTVNHFKEVDLRNPPILKYDLVIFLEDVYTDQLLYNRATRILDWGENILFQESKELKRIKAVYPPFRNIERLRMPKTWLLKLPEWARKTMMYFNIGTIKNLEFTLGSL